jgi:hypothetical protein
MSSIISVPATISSIQTEGESQKSKNDSITKDYVMCNYHELFMDRYLFMFQFTEDEIEKFIDKVSMRRVLITQKLTADFVIKYILNEDYHVNDNDSMLTIRYVLHCQPHLTEADFDAMYSDSD